MISRELVSRLPNTKQYLERFDSDHRSALVAALTDAPVARSRAIVRGGPAPRRAFEGAVPEGHVDLHAEDIVAAATSAVRKVEAHGADADVTPAETAALEAIVAVTGRPAIIVQEGRFFPPPAEWERLEGEREAIEKTLPSVGRIELTGHPRSDWVGTGFLVAPGVVMTNRHVAKEFCYQETKRRWAFEPDITATIDFVEELGTIESAEFALTEIIGVHPSLDMALFRAESTASTGPLPPPVTIAARDPGVCPDREVYIVGYPASDASRNDPTIMRRVFSNIYDVKRLQPGKVTSVDKRKHLLTHDCSTLGGNSGSCLVDLASNKVIGLHYSGRFLEANYAIALWQLRRDSLLRKAGVNFG